MKNLIRIMILLTFISCNSQDQNKVLIKKFVNQVILDESYSLKNIEEHVMINKDILKNNEGEIYQILKLNIDNIRKNIKENSSKYKIQSHNESKENELIRTYNFIYNNYDDVYYLISNDMIVTPIVIDNGKIISFFPGLNKKRGRVYPWLLN